MPDRECVITHLQIIHTWAEFAGKRDLHFFTPKHLEDIAEWTNDALELLNEQEDLGTELTNAVELIRKKNERIEKLLKEQEPAKPNGTRKAMSFAFNGMLTGYCPRCGTIVNSIGNSGACGKCGQKFDWENPETEDRR